MSDDHIPLTVRAVTKLYAPCFSLYRAIYFVYKRFSDRAKLRFLRAYIARENLANGVFLDLGANIGFYSRFFAEHTRDATIYAVEMNAENFAHLRAETARFPSVKIFNCAVNDVAGVLTFARSSNSAIDHHLTLDSFTPPPEKNPAPAASCDAVATGATGATTTAITLDELCGALPRVDIIKMDIQGAEIRALRGAKALLARSAGALIMLELFPFGFARAGNHWREFVEQLQTYRLKIISPPDFDVENYCRENAAIATAYTDLVLQVEK